MGIIIWTRDMIPILILALQVLSAVGRPQNDGLIHTDLIPERRDNLPAELIGLLMNGTARQAESRAVNSCGCAAPSSSGRIVGGSEVSPKYKYPYQIYFQANGYMCEEPSSTSVMSSLPCTVFMTSLAMNSLSAKPQSSLENTTLMMESMRAASTSRWRNSSRDLTMTPLTLSMTTPFSS